METNGLWACLGFICCVECGFVDVPVFPFFLLYSCLLMLFHFI
jgi:hypothetical protein